MDTDSNNASETQPLLRTTSEPGGTKANLARKNSSVSQATGWVPKTRPDLPPGTTLASLFRYHMGIDHDDNLVPSHLAVRSAIDPIATGKNQGRRAVNLGIYNRCIREERGASVSYQVWTVVINGALGCQVIFAAALTALGAGNGSHTLVAIFGTLNTIIAGFLTYLKGTGLPMRMKYFHNQWLKLRAYIEQRERDFASDDMSQVHRITYDDLMEEVDIVEKMYHNIRKDVEKHTPEAFGGKNDNSASEAPGEGAPEATLASRGLNAKKAKKREPNFAEDLEARIAGRHSKAAAVSNGKAAANTSALDNLDEDDEEDDGVTKLAMDRARVLQERADAGQEKAEKRIKELEAKLAGMDKSTDQQS